MYMRIQAPEVGQATRESIKPCLGLVSGWGVVWKRVIISAAYDV